MDIWERIVWEREELLPHLEDEGVLSMEEMTEEGYIEHAMAEEDYIERCAREAQVHDIISESLGNGKSIELDPATGKLTLTDETVGIEYSALEVLALAGFLGQHDVTILSFAFAAVEAGA